MKPKKKTKIFTSYNVCLALLIIAIIVFPLSLLISKMIDGVAYVALCSLMAFSYGLYKLHPRIIEFSVGGNSIKLRETLHEAEKITKELKELRRVSMLQFFSPMYTIAGSNHDVIKRFYDFLCVYNVSAESPLLISEFKTEFINSLGCLKKSMDKFVSPLFDFDDESILSFDEQVKNIIKKFDGETEEHFRNFPGHRMARDFAMCIVLIEGIYNSVFNDDPKKVTIPEFVRSYNEPVFRG